MKVAITFMNGPRVPYDVIEEKVFPCRNYDDGIDIAKRYIQRTTGVPDETIQINVSIWEN